MNVSSTFRLELITSISAHTEIYPTAHLIRILDRLALSNFSVYQECQLLPFIRNLAKVPLIETRDVLNAIKKSVPEEVSTRIENVVSLLAIMLGKSVAGRLNSSEKYFVLSYFVSSFQV